MVRKRMPDTGILFLHVCPWHTVGLYKCLNSFRRLDTIELHRSKVYVETTPEI